MIYICLFCVVYIFYISVLQPARFYLLSPGRSRLPNKVSAYRNKLYLQMLLGNTGLLVPSARDICTLSCMLKTASIKFLHIFFCSYFLYSDGIPQVNFNAFCEMFPCRWGCVLIQKKCVYVLHRRTILCW